MLHAYKLCYADEIYHAYIKNLSYSIPFYLKVIVYNGI